MHLITLALVLIAIGLGGVLAMLVDEQQQRQDAALFTGVSVAVIGGDAEHPFAQLMHRGARDAAQDLGCQVRVLPTPQWDPEQMVVQVRTLLTAVDGERPQAICLTGHPGETHLAALIEQAKQLQVVVTSYNVDVPDARRRWTADGMGYVGNDLQDAGRRLARGCIDLLGIQAGDQAVIFSGARDEASVPLQRPRAVIEVLQQAGIDTVYRAFPPERDVVQPDVVMAMLQTLQEAHRAQIVICDSPVLAVALARALTDSHLAGRHLRIATFDLTPGVVEQVREKRIHLVGDQLPYAQGYLAVIQACLSVRGRFTGMRIDTGLHLIDVGTMNALDGFIRNGVR